MATLTFVGGSGDGYMGVGAADWATTRGLFTGIADTAAALVAAYGILSGSYAIYRSLLMPDTSGIPDNATITAKSLALTAREYVAPGQATHVVTAALTSVTAAGAALANWGATSLGSFGPTVANDARYTASLPNLTVNKTGLTYIGLRGAADLNNVAPTGLASNNWYSADATTAAYRPALTVEYTVPAGGRRRHFAVMRPNVPTRL